MPTKPETRIVKKIVRYLRQLRKDGEPVYWSKVHGSIFGNRGQPDLDIVYHGVAFKLEVKRPGKEPTAIQMHRIREWAKAGAIADVVRSQEEVAQIMSWAKQMANRVPRR